MSLRSRAKRAATRGPVPSPLTRLLCLAAARVVTSKAGQRQGWRWRGLLPSSFFLAPRPDSWTIDGERAEGR